MDLSPVSICLSTFGRWHLLIGAAHQKRYQVQTWRQISGDRWEVCRMIFFGFLGWERWVNPTFFAEKSWKIQSNWCEIFVYTYMIYMFMIVNLYVAFFDRVSKKFPNCLSKFSQKHSSLDWQLPGWHEESEWIPPNQKWVMGTTERQTSIFQKEAAKNAWISRKKGPKDSGMKDDTSTEHYGSEDVLKTYPPQRSSKIWWLPPYQLCCDFWVSWRKQRPRKRGAQGARGPASMSACGTRFPSLVSPVPRGGNPPIGSFFKIC